MASDEKRREVAQALRGLNVSDIEANGLIIDGLNYVGMLLMRIIDEANDYRPGLNYFPSHFSARAVADLFSDLIDRPTCRNVSGCQDTFECSECRCRAELVTEAFNEDGKSFHVPLLPSFCPNCGARVVEKEENDGI